MVQTMSRSTRLYPVVVTEHPLRDKPVAYLGHNLGFALGRIHEGLARMYFRDDIDALGGDSIRAYLDARERLGRLVDAKLIDVRRALGPRAASLDDQRLPLFVVRHSLLAASCIVMPNLWHRAASALGRSELAACIPRRDLLVVFPDLGPEVRSAMRRFMGQNVTLTSRLFAIDPNGPRELVVAPPTIPIYCDEIRSDGVEGTMPMASGM